MREVLCGAAACALGVALAAAACAAPAADQTYVVTPQTIQAMEKAAPDAPLVKPAAPRKVLVYGRVPNHPESVACCFKAMEVLGRKTGAFEAVCSGDPAVFLPESLRQFDAVVMNNTHEKTPMLPEKFAELSPAEQQAAQERVPILEKSLTDFVASGKGLVGIHGAAAIPDTVKFLAEMLGGQYLIHIAGQHWVKPDEPDHPLCAFLNGESFEVRDELYLLRRPLTREPVTREGVRVLLSLDLTKMPDPGKRQDGDYVVSWVRPYEKGRVFFCGLGHSKSTYTNPIMLKHFLAGIQYAIGDLKAPDAPPGR